MGTKSKRDSEPIWKAVYHGEACHTNTLAAVGKVVYIWQKKSSSHNTKKCIEGELELLLLSPYQLVVPVQPCLHYTRNTFSSFSNEKSSLGFVSQCVLEVVEHCKIKKIFEKWSQVCANLNLKQMILETPILINFLLMDRRQKSTRPKIYLEREKKYEAKHIKRPNNKKSLSKQCIDCNKLANCDVCIALGIIFSVRAKYF